MKAVWSTTTRGAAAGLGAAVLFGFSAPIGKRLVAHLDPQLLAGLLYAGAAIGFWLIRALRGRPIEEAPLRRADFPAVVGVALLGGIAGPVLLLVGLARVTGVAGSLLLNLEAPATMILLVGLASYGISVLLDAYALRLVGAAREAAYFATAPFVGALAAIILFREKLGSADLAAMASMILGVVLLAREKHAHGHTHEDLEHEHAHTHDEHHQHEHADGDPPGEPHVHVHRHVRLAHDHPHTPDAHHRHRH